MDRSYQYHKYYLKEIQRRPRVTVAVPLALYEDLEAIATMKASTKPEIMRKALEEYIAREYRARLRGLSDC